jgi:hypothetical protein|nr:MAG TPA: Arc-like DNA binding domain protein [Caudoviricetes sp.]
MGNRRDLHFRLNEHLNLQIEELSELTSQSKSVVIRTILLDWFNKNQTIIDKLYEERRNNDERVIENVCQP